MKRKLLNIYNKFFGYKVADTHEFILPEKQKVNNDRPISILDKNQSVFSNTEVNLDYIKSLYNTMINSDIKIREFTLNARGKQYNSFLVFIDGMVDSKLVNDFVLNPLMLRNQSNLFDGAQNQVISTAITNNISVKKVKKFNLAEYILNSLMPQNDVSQKKDFKEITNEINSGNCALFIDTLDTVFCIDVKGFKQRSVDKPNNEILIRGAQEAFTENLRTNTSMIRRIVNNENLIIENFRLGKITQTNCSICYIKNIAPEELIAEVKYRINNLDVDSILSSGELEQLISDNNKSTLPQVIATERPDKTSQHLMDGRVAIILNGTPYILVVPGTFVDFLSSPEDVNLKYKFSNMLRFVRILALTVTLLLPGLYISITNYHQELIPTELLFAIISSRLEVPFPVIIEILIMEVSFELIREAGLRVPSPVGPTIGIVGALILGEAAVSANIVSPILIIIVALTGISSFAIPDYSLGFYMRYHRFGYILLGYAAGFLGIGLGIFINLCLLCNLKSFGAPYITASPKADRKTMHQILLAPIWKRENRPGFLDTDRPQSQNNISIKWK